MACVAGSEVELVKEAQARSQYDEIKKFVAGTAADSSPIIPLSAVLKYNLDVVCEYLCTQVGISTELSTVIESELTDSQLVNSPLLLAVGP
jgi:translation initiation factor 2 gamma subunit (eIF-2gamma)